MASSSLRARAPRNCLYSSTHSISTVKHPGLSGPGWRHPSELQNSHRITTFGGEHARSSRGLIRQAGTVLLLLRCSVCSYRHYEPAWSMIGQLAPDSLLLLLIVKAHWPATPRGSSPKYQLPVNIDVNYRLFSMSAFGIYIFTSAEIF